MHITATPGRRADTVIGGMPNEIKMSADRKTTTGGDLICKAPDVLVFPHREIQFSFVFLPPFPLLNTTLFKGRFLY